MRSAVASAARGRGGGASQPAALNLEWADLRDADVKGRWWKQGAAWDRRRAERPVVADVVAKAPADADSESADDVGRLAPPLGGEIVSRGSTPRQMSSG